MIKVIVKSKDKYIKKIEINGHALYAEAGKDIVCAAVSSAVIITINGILSLSNTIDYVEKKDSLIITVKSEDKVTNKLLNNMLSMLGELENDYPNNIKISKEV